MTNTRAIARQATSYVTVPVAEPLAEDDPLLTLALCAFSAFGFESTPVPHTHPRKH